VGELRWARREPGQTAVKGTAMRGEQCSEQIWMQTMMQWSQNDHKWRQ
jgi:hypothetical protein